MDIRILEPRTEVLLAGGTEITDLCESAWRPGLECPNQAEFILRCLDNAGFAIMCGPHKDGFLDGRMPEQAGVEVLDYSHDLALNLQRDAVKAGL